MDIIQKRFDKLAEVALQIDGTKESRTVQRKSSVQYFEEPTQYDAVQVLDLDWQQLVQWRTSVFSLLSRVFGEQSPTYQQFVDVANEKKYHDRQAYFDHLHAVFLSAKEDFECGYLFDVRKLIHAEVFSDELEQAKHFLDAKYKVPAAVIAGVVLETTLRKLCEQHDELEPADNLNRMNDDLVKANVYNKMRADQVRAWAKIRNDAAHGNPDEFDEGEVSRMIDGVRDFVAGQMS